MASDRIAELHPNAEFKKDRWWLYRAWAPYGDIGDYPVLEALKQNAAPFCYFDTHAGAGKYDLRGVQAEKTVETADGVLASDVIRQEHASSAMTAFASGFVRATIWKSAGMLALSRAR